MNNRAKFYNDYWRLEGGAPPENGFAMEQRKAKLEKALVTLPPKAAVLDAGCGHGTFSSHIHSLGYSVTGFDISEVAIEKARQQISSVRFEVASLDMRLPFGDNEFQAVWFTEVLEHLFDVHFALVELNRVLTLQGKLILTTPYHGLIKNVMISLFGFERHYNPYLSHIRFFTRKSLDLCLRNAGFEVIKWDGVGRKWPLWMAHFVVARKVTAPGPAPAIIG